MTDILQLGDGLGPANVALVREPSLGLRAVPHPRVAVEAYLELQERFAHLFRPARAQAAIADIQARVDEYWRGVGD